MSLDTNVRLVLELVAHHGEMNNQELENLNKVSDELDAVVEFETESNGYEPFKLPKEIEDRIAEIAASDEPNSDDSEDDDECPPMCKSSEAILRRILSKVPDLLDERVGIFGRGDGGWGVQWLSRKSFPSRNKTEVAFNIMPENLLSEPTPQSLGLSRTFRFWTFAPYVMCFDDEDELVKFIRVQVAKKLYHL